MRTILICCFYIVFLVSCTEDYNDLEFIHTRVRMETELVKITDSYFEIHSEVLGGHLNNITAVGHEWQYFSIYSNFSDSIFESKRNWSGSPAFNRTPYNDLRIAFTQDTSVWIRAFVEIDETTRIVLGAHWIETAERFEMDKYINE